MSIAYKLFALHTHTHTHITNDHLLELFCFLVLSAFIGFFFPYHFMSM